MRLASRPVQAALVLVAAVASVATSAPPGWSKGDVAPTKRVEVEAGTSVSRIVWAEASQGFSVSSALDAFKPSSPGAESVRLAIRALDGPEGACRPEEVTFVPLGSDRWSRTPPDESGNSADATIAYFPVASSSCVDGARRRFVATVTNLGSQPITIAWVASAGFSGEPGSDEPADAFVRIEDEP